MFKPMNYFSECLKLQLLVKADSLIACTNSLGRKDASQLWLDGKDPELNVQICGPLSPSTD